MPGLLQEQLAAAEDLANEMVWADLPVAARFVDAGELARLELRKQPGDYQRIRVVSAGEFDHSPCGGTHPRRTGEVGMIVLRRSERRGDNARVEFVCGARVLREYRLDHLIVSRLAARLSVGTRDLPAAVDRLREMAEQARKALIHAEEQLLRFEAAELLARAERIGGAPVVAEIFEDRPFDRVRLLAKLIADGGGVALLGLTGMKAQLAFARAAPLPYDIGALLQDAATLLGGRGGGRPEIAQGGGPNVARLPESIAVAKARLATIAGS